MQDARSGTTLGYGLWLKKFMDGTCVWFFYCQIREMSLRLCRRCMCGQCSKSQAKKVCKLAWWAGQVVMLARRTPWQLYRHHFQSKPQKKPPPPMGGWPKRETVQMSPKRNSRISIPRLCQSTRVSPFIPFFFSGRPACIRRWCHFMSSELVVWPTFV